MLILALLLACGASKDDSASGDSAALGPAGTRALEGHVAPTFALLDMNPASPTAGQRVSTTDPRGEVSAWYFGHAT